MIQFKKYSLLINALLGLSWLLVALNTQSVAQALFINAAIELNMLAWLFVLVAGFSAYALIKPKWRTSAKVAAVVSKLAFLVWVAVAMTSSISLILPTLVAESAMFMYFAVILTEQAAERMNHHNPLKMAKFAH